MNPVKKTPSLKSFFITPGTLLIITLSCIFFIALLYAGLSTIAILLITVSLACAVLWLGASTRHIAAFYASLHAFIGIMGAGLAFLAPHLYFYYWDLSYLILPFTLLLNIVLASIAPFIFSLQERVAFFQVSQQPQQPQPTPQQQGQQVVYHDPYDPYAPDVPPMPQYEYQEGYRPSPTLPKEEPYYSEEGVPTMLSDSAQGEIQAQYPSM